MFNSSVLERAFEALRPFVKVGDFKLRSGRKSDLYIDVKSALLSENGFDILVALTRMVDLIKDAPGKSTHYIGYGYGGALLCSGFCAAQFGESRATIFRGEKKEHGLGNDAIGPIPSSDDRLVILEDVVTTESSVKECLDCITKLDKRTSYVIGGCVDIVAVVDRRRRQDRSLEVFSLFDEEVIRNSIGGRSC